MAKRDLARLSYQIDKRKARRYPAGSVKANAPSGVVDVLAASKTFRERHGQSLY